MSAAPASASGSALGICGEELRLPRRGIGSGQRTEPRRSSWIEGRGGQPAPSWCRNQQPGEQMAQQRESGSSGSQLLQQGRANALRLTLRPKPNAKQASNTLVRDFLFIAFSYGDGTTGALLPRRLGRRRRVPSSAGSPRLLPQPIGPAMRRFAVASSYFAVLARLAP